MLLSPARSSKKASGFYRREHVLYTDGSSERLILSRYGNWTTGVLFFQTVAFPRKTRRYEESVICFLAARQDALIYPRK
jgi:hypothetical protein